MDTQEWMDIVAAAIQVAGSQEELGEQIGCTQQNISRWAKGEGASTKNENKVLLYVRSHSGQSMRGSPNSIQTGSAGRNISINQNNLSVLEMALFEAIHKIPETDRDKALYELLGIVAAKIR